MPCRECGKSARKHGGACVGLSFDSKGIARYYCLNCVINEIKDKHQ